VNVGAQDAATLTPAIVIVTATPADGSAAATEPAVSGTPSSEATAAPREWQALNAARAVLSKKINKNLRYVTNWTWDLLMFPDSMLGCPPAGQTAAKGDTAGYKITIQPLGDKNIYELRVTFDLAKVYDCGIAGTSGTGGTSLGTAAAGSFEIGGQVLDLSAGTANAMKSAKMKWVKKQVRLGDGNGPAYIAQAHAAGFKILLSVVGQPNDILASGFFDSFAATLAGLASGGADAIEVWNEMNLDREWPNGQINPAQYVTMLSKAYAAIKAANGSTMVISGAPAPTGAAGAGGKTAAYWNDDVYMAEMAAAGAGQYADCIGLHYNEGIISPKQSSGDSRGSYPTYFFSSMLQRGLAAFPGKSACFTELGYLSPEGYGALPGGFAWAASVTVAQQAQWLAEAAVLASQSGRVRLMIVWNVDFPYFGGSDPTGGYGIIRPGGGCPACATLASVMP
jgi:hypothetical protein